MKNLKHCVYWNWCIRNRASWTILLVRSSHNFRPCLGSEKKRRRANWKGKNEYSCVVCPRPWDKSKSFVFPCKSPITWAILLSLNCQIFKSFWVKPSPIPLETSQGKDVHRGREDNLGTLTWRIFLGWSYFTEVTDNSEVSCYIDRVVLLSASQIIFFICNLADDQVL